MLSRTLESVLNNAFRDAKAKRQEFMSVEHLLLALVDDVETREILLSAGAEVDELKSELESHIDTHESELPDSDERETQPTLGFQRVLQRAVFHVQSSGRREVTGINVLIAIFTETDSQAVSLLQQQGINRIDIVNQAPDQSISVGLSDSARVTSKPGSGGHHVTLAAFSSQESQQRLEDLEGKVDQILREIQDLSSKVQRIADQFGPEE